MSENARTNSAESTIPEFKPLRPLPLSHQLPKTSITVILHSEVSVSMLRGRSATNQKQALPGLTGFAYDLTLLWRRAAVNDPYADWILIQVEDVLEELQLQTKEEMSRLTDLIGTFSESSAGRFVLEGTSYKDPYKETFSFTTPYAFLGAAALQEFDEFERQAVTARNLGLLSEEDRLKANRKLTQGFRGLYNLPKRYKPPSVTRATTNEDALREAKARMGTIPDEVMDGRRRPKVAPSPPRQ